MKSKLILATFNSGSTYVQRSLAFWIHELITDTVRNPHELLNGIAWDNGYLIKSWTDVNGQSVDDLISMLAVNQSPIVLRLAYDHSLLRRDQSELGRLYDFLIDNFDVYYCRRDDLFDYGMCYSIRCQTDRDADKQINNVYTAQERQMLYGDDQVFTVITEDVVLQARKYLEYLDWVQKYFQQARPIDYAHTEQDIDAILQTMTDTSSSIKDLYGVSISEYTLAQYALSKNRHDLFGAEQYAAVFAIETKLFELCDRKVMLDPIPIKSTTMIDKISKVTNFDACVSAFNDWAQTVGVCKIDQDWLNQAQTRCLQLYRSL